MPRCLMRGNSETVIKDCPVADPGFPRGGGANPKGGAPTYYLANFSRKLHENEEILDQRGARVPCVPLRSATAASLFLSYFRIILSIK